MYIGCTDTTFKMRHYGHATDLRVNKKDGGTELSRHVWKLREQGKDPGSALGSPQKMPAIQEREKRVWCLQH